MEQSKILAGELGISETQARAAIELIDQGNTIPFIARYRKEVTGGLDDEVLRALSDRLRYLRNLDEKKESVLSSIEDQGRLTPELRKQIEEAMTLVSLEDLYRPYRPKKRTRAMAAQEKGLAPLALLISSESADRPLEMIAESYLSDKKGLEVSSVKEALQGACDIIAEQIADRADYRTAIRKFVWEYGTVDTRIRAGAEDENRVYEAYYEHTEALKNMPGHRILAVNRGENEKVLSVSIGAPDEQIISVLERSSNRKNNPYTAPYLKQTVKDSYARLIFPAVEREIRNMLTEKAEDGAIAVFGKNLSQLLMQPPIAGKTVLGWDPGYINGCKIAVVDPTGRMLDTAMVYPTPPKNRVRETKQIIEEMILRNKVELIALGNGTASRESELLITEMIRELRERGVQVRYIIVNEAGASVYSASKAGSEEFPDLTVEQRGAISMARRLQDPLAELVKIDPKSIGVGQYQHDMDQKKLSESLSAVVEDCVNRVGVDLNTASAALLQYVSGINKTLASNIVAYRTENGEFRSRKELLKVSKLGPKAFEQCAGFLRIRDGKEPLDRTAVHPESYDIARALMKTLGYEENDLTGSGIRGLSEKIRDYGRLAEELGTGRMTLQDIASELEKPGRDPREDMPRPILRSDVLEMKDLKEGMILKGTVRNAIDFGAFVDIGVHQDGLVHISQMTDQYIRHPLEAVSVGDIVEVKVLSVDLKKKRISLTMKGIH